MAKMYPVLSCKVTDELTEITVVELDGTETYITISPKQPDVRIDRIMEALMDEWYAEDGEVA